MGLRDPFWRKDGFIYIDNFFRHSSAMETEGQFSRMTGRHRRVPRVGSLAGTRGWICRADDGRRELQGVGATGAKDGCQMEKKL